MSGRRATAVLVVLVVAGAAGCASGDGGAAATATSTGTSESAAASKQLSDQAKRVKLAECIRAHGVPHFPDPDPKGDFAFGIDVSPEVWRRATEACKDLTPPGTFSGKRSPKQQSEALRFAECIREHGVEDFPDPANGAPMIDTTHIPSSNRPGGMAVLDAAIAQCRGIVKLAAGGQG